MNRSCASHRSIGRRGFSMIELLIVITIIGILLAAMTPAIQSSREAASKLQCKNNLKQIGLAAQQHLVSWGYFPSSGWGWLWAGDPDRGFGANQPGGWVYSLLPFMEEKQLWSVGQGINFTKNPTEKQKALAGQLSQPLSVLICPSRVRRALSVWSCPSTAQFEPGRSAERRIKNRLCDQRRRHGA